ncbi:prepilin-type N-terminal cleavage/methylation domain-containing protein [Caloramator quimbayensis]|uniref:Prepilin-type N-terminal cleavage/methylation domain-containing protein n=1 Tax=Caloramator quimbayensis TaxID=1147123 RepID=A0A1T4WXY9_9CLOT|nr:type II secretion system protein [Caloramator quimbayensis]SKA82222.1 prepilin-type N-terminal cleavage/methylation domain-containing protein [Caloramator quimbayensis]
MKRKCKKGYTLVEVLAAMAIFAMLIIPVSKLIESNISVNKSSKEELETASVLSYAYEAYLQDSSLEEITYPNDSRYSINYAAESLPDEISSKDLDIKCGENNININSAYSIPASENMNIKIKINYENNKANYDIFYDSISNGEINLTVDNPNFIIYLDMLQKSSEKKINILIEGIYQDGILSDKTIKLYKKNKEGENSLNIVSVYPDLIEKTVDEKKKLNRKVIITIKKDGKKLIDKSYTFTVND